MADDGVFTISRIFDAPRDLVFQAWTKPEHLANWWGPKGCKMRVIHLDLRPGGEFHYSMAMPNGGPEIWGKFIYREISPPARLVFTNAFADAEGNVIRSFFSQTWPLEVLNILTLTEDNGRTTFTLRSSPVSASEEERATFIGMVPSMQQGWSGTLDQLADFLKQG
ncbi:SRPBCC domain-containing protein [Methylovirgula sp. 4M-Z18]|nr:SRPBCC domain-containing protein [Methylovirgula sp. 4M-Z18]